MTKKNVTRFSCFTDTLESLKAAAQTLPSAEDVEGVVTALVRLQEMYRLDPRNISLFSGGFHGGFICSLSPV